MFDCYALQWNGIMSLYQPIRLAYEVNQAMLFLNPISGAKRLFAQWCSLKDMNEEISEIVEEYYEILNELVKKVDEMEEKE
jgi:hypothetical protein